MISLGQAHVERLVLEAFVDKLEPMQDSDNKVALGLLLDLFALSTIEADRGWFMEHGRLSSQRSKAISREVGLAVPQAAPHRRGPRRRLRGAPGDDRRRDAAATPAVSEGA